MDRRAFKAESSPREKQSNQTWDGNFLDFSIQETGQADISQSSINRYKDRVRELWHVRQSKTSKQLVATWREYL